MLGELSNLKIILDLIGRLKKAFEGLTSSNLFLKETDIYDLIEKYFSLQPLPKGKIKVIGRLSNYTLSNNFPMYTPAHLTTLAQTRSRLDLRVKALNIPSISYNPIELVDKSTAKILWLYPEESEGLVYNAKDKVGLVRDNICEIFGIENKDKPILILVDSDLPNCYFYKTVEIIGKVYTSPLELYNQFSTQMDAFVLNYFSNVFRPFSSQDGVLAIDARNPIGSTRILGSNSRPFKIIYTVQGAVELPYNCGKNLSEEEVLVECLDAIPDRQGLVPIRNIGDQLNNTYSIVTMGDTFWQRDKNNSGMAAFKEINLTDISYNQARLTELANNWQVWQKTARCNFR